MAWLEGWRQHLFDIGAENVACHGAIDDQWRGEVADAQARDKRRCLPMMGWTPPTASSCQGGAVKSHRREGVHGGS